MNELSYSSLINLAQALENKRLLLDASPNLISRYVSAQETEVTLATFKKFKKLGMTEAAVAYTLQLVAQEKQERQNYQNQIEIVWTIPDLKGVRSRDTALIVRELFSEVKTQLLIATYVLDRPEKMRSIFDPLAQRMEAIPELDVSIILNIERPYLSNKSGAVCLREFTEKFRHHLWQGSRFPDVFYDARSLNDNDAYIRSCFHAKFIVADAKKIFLTSANFTEAAHTRNIEAGIIIEDKIIANKIIKQVELLINGKVLVKLPGLYSGHI